MASTRNNNTSGNYCLQQRDYNLARNWINYNHSSYGKPYTVGMPSIGYTPSHMSRDTLSYNAVDIESSLYGINSTNLVNPQQPVNPQLKKVPTICYFEKIPLIMPEPLVMNNKQRPFVVP